ncbi:MAG: stage III sporulation protein AD [Oscillospiraceae bacterium]|nr:stage III sporulation protein AD [Oscillospiraceae bacterium]
MGDIVKLAAVAVMGALCALTVRKQAPELAMVVGLATGVLLLWAAMSALTALREFLDSLIALSGLSPAVLSPLVKTIGIAIITHIASEICRDAGEGGIAAFAETAGGALALCVALPLMRAVLSMVTGLV